MDITHITVTDVTNIGDPFVLRVGEGLAVSGKRCAGMCKGAET